ncbi:MAG TPA: hypothetical protein VLY23_12380 [Candidatus Acidoferrum sp.]|nr:hypothetical protein [Candidatus Acidoferrum sp.]
MWKTPLSLTVLSAALALVSLPNLASPQKQSRAEAEKVDLHITGEVTRGNTFEQDIGHGLVFRLVPSASYQDLGWQIHLEPKTEPGDGPVEFSSVATPPYHRYNPRFLEASWGNSAQDAVKITRRVFYFVESVDDEHRAEECLNAVTYPTDTSDEEKVRVAAEQAEIRLGRGELRILKSHLERPKPAAPAGTIDSLRFEVDFEFSSGLTMADILAKVARPE